MAAHQAPPSLGFSRQEHWSGLPCPSPMHESENQSEVTLSCLTPSDPMDCSLPGPPYTGFSRQEYWSGFPSPRLPQNSETHRDNVFDITALTKLALLCLLRIWCFSGAISSSWHSFHMNCAKMPFVLRLMWLISELKLRTFLVVQWLRRHAPNTGGPGLIPGREIYPTWCN